MSRCARSALRKSIVTFQILQVDPKTHFFFSMFKNKSTLIQTKFSSHKSKYCWESTALHRCPALMQVCTLTAFLLFIYSTYSMHVISLSLCSMLETVVSVNDMQNFPYFQKEKTFTGRTATVNICKYCHVVSVTGNRFSGSPQIFFIFQYLWIFYMLQYIS